MDGDFDRIDQVRAFVAGLDRFRRELGFVRDPDHFAVVFAAAFVARIGEHAHPVAEFQACQLARCDVGAEFHGDRRRRS